MTEVACVLSIAVLALLPWCLTQRHVIRELEQTLADAERERDEARAAASLWMEINERNAKPRERRHARWSDN